MKNLILLLAGLGIFTGLSAQVSIGHWETFQTYSNGTYVSVAGTTVFCGTTQGLYSYDYSTSELAEYTKPMGYAGLGVTATGYSSKNNSTIVAYTDANLDIIRPNEIVNLPQIKNYSLTGDKNIYNITIIGDSAILSCGFGVVIVDMRQEIIKTDVKFSDDISFAGAVCYDAAFMSGNYYFATSQGVYKVPYNVNIKNLSYWQLIPGISSGIYNNVAAYNDTVYFSFSNYLTNALDNSDIIYAYDGTTAVITQPGWAARIVDITANQGNLGFLSYTDTYGDVKVSSDGVSFQTISGCFDRPSKLDFDVNDGLWVSCNGLGLKSYIGTSCDNHYLDGPFSKNVWDMDIVNGDIWVAAGGVNINWGNLYLGDKIYYRKSGDWKWFNIPPFGHYEEHKDIHTIVVDPSNSGHMYAGSWGTGLYEGINFTPTNQYLLPNVDSATALSNYKYRVGGVDYDKNGNLWFSNSGTDTQLKVKRANNTWGAFTLSGTSSSSTIGKVIVDDRDQVWVAVHGKGIVVCKQSSNGFIGSQKTLTSTYNLGDLPQLTVRAMACDQDGQMWVGTHDGIRVFSTSQIFTATNINGQKIVIKDDAGINELLLKETVINDIEVDGANRKWIATMGTGVRLVSSDGREIIQSFTAENSPLLSNNVYCIAIDDKSGEVCFGTDQGICCFRSDATAGTETFGNVYAFPNPVKPTYDGPIAITGMANNSTVKITDIAGNLVYETTSQGGQAIWDGKKYDGKRPSTGVYLVFCVNEDASQTVVTKILFIN